MAPARPSNPPCPCGSDQKYGACCRRFHRGEEPADAPTLMRARFSAYALGEAPFLFRTLHPDHHIYKDGEAAHTVHIRKAQQTVRYRRLTVLDSETDPEGQKARVLFHAEIYQQGKEESFLEASEFLRTEKGWRYRDGNFRAVSRAELEKGSWSLRDFP